VLLITAVSVLLDVSCWFISSCSPKIRTIYISCGLNGLGAISEWTIRMLNP
jgi:hypothetical protein